jgi:hypothetical protein
MLNGSIEYALSSDVAYTNSEGKKDTGVFIALYAPSVSQMKHASLLKQLVMRAIGESNKNNTQKPDSNDSQKSAKGSEITGDDFLMVLMSSPSIDFLDAVNAFKALLCSGAGKIDGKEKLSDSIINAMSADDFEKMMGVYLEGFLLGSLIAKLK